MIGTTAALIAAGIGAAGSIGSAAIGARGAKNAAQTQANAANQAGELVRTATDDWTPYLVPAANSVSDEVNATANNAAVGVDEAAQAANGYLNPYSAAGQDALVRMSDLVDAPDFEEREFNFTQQDPSYQWRLQQGTQALERSAAGRGMLRSGAAAKAMTGYAQGMASQEYGAEFDRFRRTQDAAFNRFSTQRAQRGALLSNVAGMGLDAGSRAGSNLINSAQYGGDIRTNAAQFGGTLRYGATNQVVNNQINAANTRAGLMVGAGNATAAGQAASANAWGTGIANAGNSAAEMILLRNLINPVSPAPPPAPAAPAGGVNYGIVPPNYRLPAPTGGR